jgi:hypothetical protein
LLAVLEIALIYYGMGNVGVIGCAPIITLYADVIEYVAGIAGVSDSNTL